MNIDSDKNHVKLEKILLTEIPNIYISLHGDNWSKNDNDNSLEENCILEIPENLFIIHFFKPGFSAYSNNEHENNIKKDLSSPSWIYKSTKNGLKDSIKSSIHLYYPGENMYNQYLIWDWGRMKGNQAINTQKDTTFDIYEIHKNKYYKKYQEEKNNLEPLKLTKSKFIPGGEYISKMQKIAWNKEKGNEEGKLTNLKELLNYISEETKENFSDKSRLIYIFNCDPYKEEDQLSDILWYINMHKIKEYYENNGKNNYKKFLDYIGNKPRCSRGNTSIHLNITGLDNNLGSYGRNESPYVSNEENSLKEKSIKDMHSILMTSKISKKNIIKIKDIEKFLKNIGERKGWNKLRLILNTCSIDNKLFKYNHNIDELAKIIAKYLLKNKYKSKLKKLKLKINYEKIK